LKKKNKHGEKIMKKLFNQVDYILLVQNVMNRDELIINYAVVQEGKAAKTESCTDTERKKVQDQIMAYVNSAPAPAAAASNAPPPPASPPSKRAEPTPTSQKK